MKHVFGPVPSRRLGRSLGIDPVPSKTCNWNCVYCQLGRTHRLEPERADAVPVDEILAEALPVVRALAPGEVDWVSVVGSGETTLCASLGRLVRELKAASPAPVCVITNGSLLHRADVRQDLLAADAVMTSLDAGDEATFRRVDRPHRSLTLEQHVRGLRAFRAEYHGRLWVQVMLVRGMNDGEASLRAIAALLDTVGPDAVHVGSPTRPPAEDWAQATDEEHLAWAERLLGERAVRVAASTAATVDLAGGAEPLDAVIATIRRHPLAEDEIVRALDSRGVPPAPVLAGLAASGQVQAAERDGRRFWVARTGSRNG